MKNQKAKTESKHAKRINLPYQTPTIKKYIKIAYSTPVLKKQEEIDLLKKIKEKNCQDSVEKIINSYLRTVISLSSKYCYGNNLSPEDGIQSGITGILKSIDSFDLKKYIKINDKGGSLFSYYCYRAIIMELTKFYRSNIRQFSVPDSINTQLQGINKLYKSGELNLLLEDQYNDNLANFISSKIKISNKKAKELLSLFSPPVELDLNIEDGEYEKESSTSFYKDLFVKNDKENEPDKIVEKEEKYSFLLRSVHHLPDEEKSIIKSRYGIGCEKKTISELSKRYKINPSVMSKKISSIEKKLHSLMVSEDYGI